MKNIKIDKEKKFMHQISDIREELLMIKSIIMQQQEIWKDCWEDCFENKSKDSSKAQDIWKGVTSETRSWLESILERPRTQIPKFLRRIDKIDKDAERVENWISSQLDLKVKHAGLKEAHNSLIEHGRLRLHDHYGHLRPALLSFQSLRSTG